MLAALAALSAAPAQATTVSIDFEDYSSDSNYNLPVGYTYSEDGFVLEVLEEYAGIGVASGASISEAFWLGYYADQHTGAASFTRDDGGLFTFDYVTYDNYSTSSWDSKVVALVGYRNDVAITDTVLVQSIYGAGGENWDPFSGVYIDELRLIVQDNGVNGNELVFNEFRFTEVSEVPLPAALPLFIAGIAGIGAASRRRKARYEKQAA